MDTNSGEQITFHSLAQNSARRLAVGLLVEALLLIRLRLELLLHVLQDQHDLQNVSLTLHGVYKRLLTLHDLYYILFDRIYSKIFVRPTRLQK